MIELTREQEQRLERSLLEGVREDVPDIWAVFVDDYICGLCAPPHGAGDYRMVGTLEDKIAIALLLRPSASTEGRLQVSIDGDPRLTVPVAAFKAWIENELQQLEDEGAPAA